MSAWVEWKKELGVSINIYEVHKSKKDGELILLMRAWDVYVVVIKLGPKGPANESISVLELNTEYNSTSESVGSFLSAATKKYGGAERVRELILSIERPGLNPTLEELEMAKKATKTTAKPAKKKASGDGVSLKSISHPTKKNAAKVEKAVIGEPIKKSAAKKKTSLEISTGGKNNIGSLVRQLLIKRLSSEEILTKVISEFPNARTSAASIAWYRGKMKAAGELPGD